MLWFNRCVSLYLVKSMLTWSIRVFNKLSIKFFVFSTHLEEKQQLNDKSFLGREKLITVDKNFNC